MEQGAWSVGLGAWSAGLEVWSAGLEVQASEVVAVGTLRSAVGSWTGAGPVLHTLPLNLMHNSGPLAVNLHIQNMEK